MLKDHKGTGISGMVLKVRTSLLVPVLVGLQSGSGFERMEKMPWALRVLFQHHFFEKRKKKKKTKEVPC